MKRLWTLIILACIARLIYMGFAEPTGERLPAAPGMYTLGAPD